MDDHGQPEYGTTMYHDYGTHEHMFHTFLTLTKATIAVTATIVILLAIFLT